MWRGKNLRMLRGWGSLQGPKRQTKVHLINLIPRDPGWSWYWVFSDTPNFNVNLKWLKHPGSRQQKLKTLRNPKLLWPICSPAFTRQISPFWGLCDHHGSTNQKRRFPKRWLPQTIEIFPLIITHNPITLILDTPIAWSQFCGNSLHPPWFR